MKSYVFEPWWPLPEIPDGMRAQYQDQAERIVDALCCVMVPPRWQENSFAAIVDRVRVVLASERKP